MEWTLEMATYLEEAPWPATKDELIDFALKSGAPGEVLDKLEELEDDGQSYNDIEDVLRDRPRADDVWVEDE